MDELREELSQRRLPPTGQEEPIRVVVVDDHDLFRTGMVSYLGSQPDIEVVGQGSNGHMGVRLAGELRPDVVLLDMRMPDFGGIEATRAILEHDPGARVVALTVASDGVDVTAAMEAGARGYVTKDTSIDGVVAAVRAAAQDATWLSPRAADVILDQLRRLRQAQQPDSARTEGLTSRELEVLRLVAGGMENAEIAEALSISPRTAKNHVSAILAKLGVSSRVMAATLAVRRGLV